MAKTIDGKGPILDAAYEILSTRGYADTSVRDVAALAGVSTSQVPYHFGDKETLLIEVLMRAAAYWQEKLKEIARTEPDPRACIAGARHLFEFALNDRPGLIRLYLDYLSLTLWNERVQQADKRVRAQVMDVVLEFLGLPDSTENRGRAQLLIAAMDGLAYQWLWDQEERPLRFALDQLEMVALHLSEQGKP